MMILIQTEVKVRGDNMDITFDTLQTKNQGELYGFRNIENICSQDEEYLITKIY